MRLAVLILALVPSLAWGDSWSSVGNDQYHTTKSREFPEEDHNPGPDEQKRLVVEWGRVSIGCDVDVGDPNAPGELQRQWKDDDLHPSRQIGVRGRLLIESPDGTRREPIDWLQGVRVVVAREAGQTPDWSRRHERDETVSDDCVVRKNGEFFARLEPAAIRRAVGKTGRFQAALSLGTKARYTITWTNTTGVLPQSVAMLTIPGPPPISRTLQLINGAPSYRQHGFDPQRLVRAVNLLRPLGKDQIIQELREFLKIARENNREDRIEDDIDTSDRTCVFLIVRLLFEPDDPAHPAPIIATCPFLPVPSETDRRLWPDYPLHIQDDVPFFLLLDIGGMGGYPSQPEAQVEWAEKHGRIRPRALRPIDNPVVAARRLAADPQAVRLYAEEEEQDPFVAQAWRSLRDKVLQSGRSLDDFEGEAWVEAASKLETRWDEAAQEYRLK